VASLAGVYDGLDFIRKTQPFRFSSAASTATDEKISCMNRVPSRRCLFMLGEILNFKEKSKQQAKYPQCQEGILGSK
jgi:hypothetical protein